MLNAMPARTRTARGKSPASIPYRNHCCARIELNNTAKVAGLAWQQRETFNKISIKAMASKVLCKRHNEALSKLDTGVTFLAQTVNRFDKSNPSANESASFSGSDFERWMLKCLLGLSASGNITGTLKSECLDLLFSRQTWPPHWGLYFSIAPRPIYHTDSILIETLTDPTGVLILATKFFIQGLPFILLLGKPGDPGAFGIWRPEKLVFKFPGSEKTLHFTWDGGARGPPVILTRAGSYGGHPPSWKDWERIG